MEYTEIEVRIKSADLETAEAVAQMASPHGFYVEDYSDMLTVAPNIRSVDFYDAALLAKDTENALVHIYLSQDMHPTETAAFIGERLRAERIECEIKLNTVQDVDWAEKWKAFYKPFRASRRIEVCPSWESCENVPQGTEVLKIDPGMAFGSGTHETTKLCVQALDDIVKGGERVLDLGCGSGILAIAAAALGAGEICAADVEAVAVDCAQKNAALNGVNMKTVLGDPTACADACRQIGSGFDIIVSNIVADVIIAYKSYYMRALRCGGTLAVSGIIAPRAEEVAGALSAEGFLLQERRELSDWVCFVFLKP